MRFAPLIATTALALAGPAQARENCQLELVVLGAGQDAGAPQIGNADDGPRLLPSSLALIDRKEGKRYLFDASPAITEQLAILDSIEPLASGSESRLGIDGVFLTHAHMGHYLGLAWLGFEAANPKGIRVYAMPRMAEFLHANGPWSQLVEFGNISISKLRSNSFVLLSPSFAVQPLLVPHRDEFSETVGFAIRTGEQTALYLPDLDSWAKLEEMGGVSLEDLVAEFDNLFIDATFWDDNELGRDMSAIPHPRVQATMDMLQHLPPDQRTKVHFIHYNHSNPIRDPRSTESDQVKKRGFNVARRGMKICLDKSADPKPSIE